MSVEAAEAHPGDPGRARRARSILFELVETVVLTIVIFVGIQTFVAQPYKVQQRSMEDTLQPGQYVLVDKLTPRWAQYSRGDIVVFDPPASFAPDTGGVPLIKRVIGLPGDRVELRGGKVYVNDVALAEPYVFEDGGVRQTTDPGPGGQTEWLVPAGSLLVMGDHRQDSTDSRTFGTVEVAHVIGRAWLRYWPIDSFGLLHAPAYAGVP
jgi:signal peptidase I